MYDTIKKLIHIYYIIVPICVIVCIVACILCYANRDSNNTDTSGIQNAQQELVTVRQEQSRAIEQNRTANAAITDSIDLNERASQAITSSETYNQRTEQAVTTSKSELAEATRIVRENARLIDESRNILKSVDTREKEKRTQTQDN